MKLRPGAALLLVVALAAAAPAHAGGLTPRELYTRALERERVLRNADRNPTVEQLRSVVNAYDLLVRRFPVSGYSDNALWQAGNLALLAYERFGQPVDKRAGAWFLNRLKEEYPASSLISRVDEVLRTANALQPITTAALAFRPQEAGPTANTPSPEQGIGLKGGAASPERGIGVKAGTAAPVLPEAGLKGGAASSEQRASSRAVNSTPESPAVVPAFRPAAPAPAAALSSDGGSSKAEAGGGSLPAAVTIRDIRRTALPDGTRVTIEMDGESSYRAERLDSPRRVFFDLKGTRAVPALQDASLKFTEDVVREVRLGRHPQNTTRIVFDMEGVDGYSVFTLYNPFRLVIDFKAAASSKPVPVFAAAPEPPPIALATALPPPVFMPTLMTRAAPEALADAPEILERPTKAVPEGLPSRPLASRPVTSATPIPPAVPSANAGGRFSLARQLGLGAARIVIDAGHGGHDPGAQSNGLNESELVLDVALRLSRLLEKQPGVEVVMTRDTDVFIPLEERTAIANREGADFFLSIHANASRNPKARGIETYFLNFASNPDAQAVAARENSTSARGMHNLPDIVRAIALNNKLDESRDFAEIVQQSMVRRLSPRNKQLKDLGVKQAPFVVLIGAAMPSVLAEISFVTNRPEGQLLKSGAYRQQIAEALLDGVLRYQQSLKKISPRPLGMGAR